MRTVDEGQRYCTDFHARLIAAGREPRDLKILPGIHPIVGTSYSGGVVAWTAQPTQ
jgi:alkanesulfonate monooxygenase SsuD/methylene tetrahydromethanopterin reductase-like flavin-dependent oxidoreductase (luciferase family)